MFNSALLKTVWEQSRVCLCIISGLLVLCLLLLLVQNQFVAPETQQLERRKAALQSQLKEREAKLAQSGVPISAVEQMERDLANFSALIPKKQKFADFLGDLFRWADQAELEIREVKYQPEIDEETKYLHYGLNFSLEGDYKQIKKFIHLLENSPRILIIDKITLTGRQTKEKQSLVQLQINLTSVFQEDSV
jgi:type IV pilus assembly protein PilO